MGLTKREQLHMTNFHEKKSFRTSRRARGQNISTYMHPRCYVLFPPKCGENAIKVVGQKIPHFVFEMKARKDFPLKKIKWYMYILYGVLVKYS